MAFTGTPVVLQVADNVVRVTGISLSEGGISGTIGLHPKTVPADVVLPQAFKPGVYKNPEGHAVSLIDSIEVTATSLASPTTAVPLTIVKTGTTPLDFVITVTDALASEAAGTGALEFYVRFH